MLGQYIRIKRKGGNKAIGTRRGFPNQFQAYRLFVLFSVRGFNQWKRKSAKSRATVLFVTSWIEEAACVVARRIQTHKGHANHWGLKMSSRLVHGLENLKIIIYPGVDLSRYMMSARLAGPGSHRDGPKGSKQVHIPAASRVFTFVYTKTNCRLCTV